MKKNTIFFFFLKDRIKEGPKNIIASHIKTQV
jgi:hypothetical protein